MRVRPSDVLTDQDYCIGICRQCSRYGQLDKTQRVCTVTDPLSIFGLTPQEESEWFRRTRYCNRVKKARENRANRSDSPKP